MEDVHFLYDQVLECLARLHCFAAARSNPPGNGDVEDDLDSLFAILARRDLLMLAASTRNFVERSEATQLSREVSIFASEIFISGGPPFFRDTKSKVTAYQCLSRILHATDLEIYRSATQYFALISGNMNDWFWRSAAYKREGRDNHAPEEPLVAMTTERDGLTLVRLTYVLNAACDLMNQVAKKLHDEKKIILNRDLR